ncbi:hypothetical protein [Deinococcus alpinitundrae]|uniref:hypothetical protein n=1 Tax=Deinococcus alpinitundrae TaxID=468913 RepID=UPI0013798901|nr:hypothetical protein [Deinococcus alpinitundrae]
MTALPLDLGTKQVIFRRLQHEERALWDATQLSTSADDDGFDQIKQERAFREERESRRRAVGREWDLGTQQLRVLELEGVLSGWPLDDR